MPRYRLRTNDQESARRLLLADERLRDVRAAVGDLVFTADETTVGIAALVRRSSSSSSSSPGSASYVGVLLLALLAAGLVSGGIAWGFKPVVDLTGTRLSAGHGLGLAFAGLGVFAIPLVAIAAFGIFLSTATRNSAAAIVGTLVYALSMEAIVGLVHVHWLPHYMVGE